MGKNTIKTDAGKILSFYPFTLKIDEKEQYTLRQNTNINAFLHMSKRHIIQRKLKNEANFMDIFTLEKADIHEINKAKANILFDFLNCKAYQNFYKNTYIPFTLQEYALFTGRKPTNSLKLALLEAILCLESVKIYLSPVTKQSKLDHVQIPILTGFHAVQGGKFLIEFYDKFLEHLSVSPLMNVHKGLYSADQRKFKYITLMGRYIEEQRRINHHNSRRDKEGLLLTVKSLWESDPDAPTYEEINDRHYQRRIIEPFEAHMNELTQIIGFDWFYCDKAGEPSKHEKLYQDGRVKLQFK